jgi:hypothetical protein
MCISLILVIDGVPDGYSYSGINTSDIFHGYIAV